MISDPIYGHLMSFMGTGLLTGITRWSQTITTLWKVFLTQESFVEHDCPGERSPEWDRC